jgi:hypothetical protein
MVDLLWRIVAGDFNRSNSLRLEVESSHNNRTHRARASSMHPATIAYSAVLVSARIAAAIFSSVV